MQLRRAEERDLEAIHTIYNREVTGSTVTFDLVPRSPIEQGEWLAEHSGVYPVIVAEQDGEVLGFASLTSYRPRPAYATTAEDSVYVRDDVRGKGVGRALLEEIVQLARAHGFHAIIARIVGDHEASIALHAKVGFEVIGVEKEVGRKFGHWLDVAVMQLLVGSTNEAESAH